jgi:hypothetical protein
MECQINIEIADLDLFSITSATCLLAVCIFLISHVGLFKHILRWGQTTCGMIIPEYRSALVLYNFAQCKVVSYPKRIGNMRKKPRFEPGVSVCIKINILKLRGGPTLQM